MSKPEIPARTPFVMDCQPGKYAWCACGKSQKQPFCDGSHKGGSFTPVKYSATESKDVYFCGCKASGNMPLCDGSHKKAV